jgi:hypothetical protein
MHRGPKPALSPCKPVGYHDGPSVRNVGPEIQEIQNRVWRLRLEVAYRLLALGGSHLTVVYETRKTRVLKF